MRGCGQVDTRVVAAAVAGSVELGGSATLLECDCRGTRNAGEGAKLLAESHLWHRAHRHNSSSGLHLSGRASCGGPCGSGGGSGCGGGGGGGGGGGHLSAQVAAHEAGACSLAWTGTTARWQECFSCLDCGLAGQACCCAHCARLCHAGHRVLPVPSWRKFYCDCPLIGCGCRALHGPT